MKGFEQFSPLGPYMFKKQTVEVCNFLGKLKTKSIQVEI